MICNHLAFESEEFSKKILDICTEGINISGHDAFKPYFDVMSPLFSIQGNFCNGHFFEFLQTLLKKLELSMV